MQSYLRCEVCRFRSLRLSDGNTNMLVKLIAAIVVSVSVYADLGIDIDLQSFHCHDNVGTNRDCNRRELDTRILVNGNYAIKRKPGWNLVVVDHLTGTIEAARSFDTWHSAAANAHMENFIKSIKDKRIVLGAAHSRWGYNMNHRGIRAVNSITGSGFSIKRNNAGVFIGYKDSFAPPDDFVERVFTPEGKGPAHLHVIVGKIKYGSDLHFTLKSSGYLDRGALHWDKMDSYIRYEGKRTLTRFGLTFMAIEHSTGKLYATKWFDTHTEPNAPAGAALDFLYHLPKNLIVLGVVHSDWTKNAGNQLPAYMHRITFTRVPNAYDASWAFVGYTGGRSALPAADFPLARMTAKTHPPHLRRHFLKIHYFTGRRESDECTNGQARCSGNAECRNTIGSYECYCKKGFEKMKNKCVDIDECQNGTTICGRIAKCTNTAGSYTCNCDKHGDAAKLGINCNDVIIEIHASACFHKNSKSPVCSQRPIRIEMNGKNLLQKPERGFKVIVLNSQTGAIEKSLVFDTWLGKDEGNRLAYALYSLENFKIVIGAVMSDETRHIPELAWKMIRKISGVTPPAEFMGAFGFIGFSGPGVPAWAVAKSTQLYGGTLIVQSRFWLMPAPPYLSMNIVSTGTTNNPLTKTEIVLQGKPLAMHLKPGFNIAVLSGSTGTLESMRSFDTRYEESAHAAKMVTFLNHLPVDRIVIGVVKGDAYRGISSNPAAHHALSRLIASPAQFKSAGASYAFVGSTFTGTEQKPPYVDQMVVGPGKGPATLSSLIGLSSKGKEIKVKLVSTGCDDQGVHRIGGIKCHKAACSIAVDGKELALNGRGINVVAISRITAHVLSRKRFDTARSHSEVTSMVEFINELPASTIVLGVVKDDAYGYATTPAFKRAMKRLLGQEPADFVARGAYAFIGYKGKVKEAWVQQKHAAHRKGGVFLNAKIPLRPELSLKLESMACDDQGVSDCNRNKNIININGKNYSRDGRGFNLAVIDFESGDVEQTAHFDTWRHNEQNSEKMEKFIKAIKPRRIVIGVIKDEAYTSLKAGAKKAIAYLIHKQTIAFSAIRQSYIFVGFTSKESYSWIQEKHSLRYVGPTKLELQIPLAQSGCVFPAPPLNGQVRVFEYDVTQRAKYRCKQGYRLSAKPQTCGVSGKWTGEVPACQMFQFGGAGGGGEGGGGGGFWSSSMRLKFNSITVLVAMMMSLLVVWRAP